jgi:hypothetical protein
MCALTAAPIADRPEDVKGLIQSYVLPGSFLWDTPQPPKLVRRPSIVNQNYPFYFGERSPHLLWRLDIEHFRVQRLKGSFQLIGGILRRSTIPQATVYASTPSTHRSPVADIDDMADRQALEGNRFQVFAWLKSHGCCEHNENAGPLRSAEEPAYLGDEELGVVLPIGERVNVDGGRIRFAQRFLQFPPIEIVYLVLVE